MANDPEAALTRVLVRGWTSATAPWADTVKARAQDIGGTVLVERLVFDAAQQRLTWLPASARVWDKGATSATPVPAHQHAQAAAAYYEETFACQPSVLALSCLLPGPLLHGMHAVLSSVLCGEVLVTMAGPGHNIRRKDQRNSPLQFHQFCVVRSDSSRTQERRVGMCRVALDSSATTAAAGQPTTRLCVTNLMSRNASHAVFPGDTVRFELVKMGRKKKKSCRAEAAPTGCRGCILGFAKTVVHDPAALPTFPVHRVSPTGDVVHASDSTTPLPGRGVVSVPTDSPLVKHLRNEREACASTSTPAAAATAATAAVYAVMWVTQGVRGCYEDSAAFAARQASAALEALRRSQQRAAVPGTGAGAGDPAASAAAASAAADAATAKSQLKKTRAAAERKANKRRLCALESAVASLAHDDIACRHTPLPLSSAVAKVAKNVLQNMRNGWTRRVRAQRLQANDGHSDKTHAWATGACL